MSEKQLYRFVGGFVHNEFLEVEGLLPTWKVARTICKLDGGYSQVATYTKRCCCFGPSWNREYFFAL